MNYKNVKSLIDNQYNVNCDEEAIKTLVLHGMTNKLHILKAMQDASGFDDDTLTVYKESTLTYKPDASLVADAVYQLREVLSPLCIKYFEVYYSSIRYFNYTALERNNWAFNDEMIEIYKGNIAYRLNMYVASAYSDYNEEDAPEIDAILKGCTPKRQERFNKYVNRVFTKALEDAPDDAKTLYNKAYAIFSDEMKDKSQSVVLTASVSLVDFVNMSYGDGWDSCHNAWDGCYAGGSISYAVDSSTLILKAYNVPKAKTASQVIESLKNEPMPCTARAVAHYQSGCGVVGRLYPMDRDNDSQGANARALRNAFNELFKEIFKGDLCQTTTTNYTVNYSNDYLGYCDFKAYNLSYIEAYAPDGFEFLGIGGGSTCSLLDRYQDLQGDNGLFADLVECSECGEYINRDEACWSDKFDCWLCPDCACWSDYLDDYIPSSKAIYSNVMNDYIVEDDAFYSDYYEDYLM